MHGAKEILEQLNHLLTGELTAADQYFIHGTMLEDWGLLRLSARVLHEMEDERGHADQLIRRILFLEGRPDVGARYPLKVGKTLPEMLAYDLETEREVCARLKVAIALCETHQDFETRRILGGLLKDTEMDHAHWLEQQLGLIERVGLKNYQQSQIEP